MASKTTLAESLLDEIATAVHFHLKKLGVAEPKALEIGAAVAEKIRLAFGGQALYIPLARRQLAAERDAEMVAAFTGNNHAELAARFGVSTIHVYRIIKRRSAKGTQ